MEWDSVSGKEGTNSQGLQKQEKAGDRDRGRESVV